MSSSDRPSASRFLLVVALATAVCFLALLFLTVWLDPFGALYEHNEKYGSRAGMKARSDAAIGVLALRTPVEHVFIGSSRVRSGFIETVLPYEMKAVSLNLAQGGLKIEDIQQILLPIIETQSTKNIWLGLDFGAFAGPKSARSFGVEIDDTRGSLRTRFRRGIASPPAMLASFEVLVSRNENLKATSLGFITTDQLQPPPEAVVKQTFQMAKRWRIDLPIPQEMLSHRLKILSDIIDSAETNNLRVVAFISPSPPLYYDILNKTDGLRQYLEWSEQVKKLIPDVRDFSDWTVWSQAREVECIEMIGEGCDFYDITHYRPSVASKMLSVMRNIAQN